MMFKIKEGEVESDREVVTLTTLASIMRGLATKWKKVSISFLPDELPHAYTGVITCSGVK